MKFCVIIFLCLLLSNSVLAQYTSDGYCGTFVKYVPDGPVTMNPASGRPILQDEQTIQTDHFVIHYTEVGINATSEIYAEDVGVYAEMSWDKLHVELGWLQPPSDNGRGGNNLYDIYIINISDRGVTQVEDYSPTVEGSPTFFIVDIGFTSNELKATVAHEFSHACQFAMTAQEYNTPWIYEASATWMLTLVFPDTQEELRFFNNLGYNMVNPLNHPEIPVDNPKTLGYYSYANFIFIKFFTEWLNDESIIKKFWEALANDPGSSDPFTEIYYILTSEYDTDLDEALREYAIWRYFTGYRDDGLHFSIASILPEAVEENYSTGGTTGLLFGMGSTRFIPNNSDHDLTYSFVAQSTTKNYKASIIEYSDDDSSGIVEIPLNLVNGYLQGQVNARAIEYNKFVFVPVYISTGQNSCSFLTTELPSRSVKIQNYSFLGENLPGELLVNSQTFPSGTRVSLPLGSNNSVKTLQERFLYSPTLKHLSWDQIASDYFLNTNFPVDVNKTQQTAYFNQLQSAQLKVLLEDVLVPNSGKLKFYDPWYLFSNGTQAGMNTPIEITSFYEPTGGDNVTGKGVFLNQNIVSGLPYYQIEADAIQYVNAYSRNFYFQKWSSTNVNWENQSALKSGIMFQNNNASVTANYKGALVSNQSDAFTSNGQRKVVRDNNGIYHCVYTSMNKLWYTKSTTTDFGGSWTQDVTFEIYSAEDEIIKNPSLDIYNNSISIVFEYGYPDLDAYQILTGLISASGLTSIEVVADIDVSSFGQSYPVVAKFSNETFFVYKRSVTEPLKYKRIFNGIWSTEASLPNAGTDSKRPTMDKRISGTNDVLMAWQESNTIIKYQGAYNQGNYKNFNSYSIPSNGSGYTYNHSPSLFAIGYGARIVWVGERDIDIEDGNLAKENYIYREKRVVLKDPSYYRFWSFGNDVNSPSINTNDALNGYVFAWAESENYINKFSDNSLSTPITMNTQGKDIQVIKGSNDKSTMFGMSFDSQTLPYKLTPSNSFAVMSKVNALAFSSGRQGIIYKDDAYFYFLLGDIQRNNLPVKFIEFPDTAYIQSLSDMNSYLITEPFTLSDNTPFSFNAQYGVSDSLSTRLLENGNIGFRIELVDNTTGAVLGQFVDEEFHEDNYSQCNSQSFNLNTNGIGNRTVVLRIVTEYNQEADFSIGDILADVNLLPKTNAQEVSFKGNLNVKEYALEQNYPNPFNPATTISYSIPKDGHVTLKIYDILGNELSTLISKYQSSGKYTLKFNAENLASGVYLYRLQVEDFVSSKKMTLIK